MRWQDSQRDISICEECVGRWRGRVTEPLQIGEIPVPQSFVKILFVGVAPTDLEGRNKGGHFYSSAGDNLRRGLFRLLNDRFAIPLNGLSLEEGNQLFHGEGYFFVHAGKTRPVGRDAPPRDILIYCANRHLRTEIDILNPSAICFLGVKNLKSVTQSLFDRQVFEVPGRASLDRWTGWVVLAPQPVRGGERRTEIVLAKLLKLVN
jgi:uracil-DNA glycosylase